MVTYMRPNLLSPKCIKSKLHGFKRSLQSEPTSLCETKFTKFHMYQVKSAYISKKCKKSFQSEPESELRVGKMYELKFGNFGAGVVSNCLQPSTQTPQREDKFYRPLKATR